MDTLLFAKALARPKGLRITAVNVNTPDEHYTVHRGGVFLGKRSTLSGLLSFVKKLTNYTPPGTEARA